MIDDHQVESICGTDFNTVARPFGLNPDEILTKEALAKPHRTIIKTGIETDQMNTLLETLKQKLKQELATNTLSKRVEITT
jgi:hypothetical protein